MPAQDKHSSSQRQQMIAEAAYFKAERRGFSGGDPIRDWCEAEAEVDARLREAADGQLVARVEEALESAAKRITAMRRKLARLSAEARAEWERDLDKVAMLRDSLKPRLEELRKQGERASRKLREQAEKTRGEIAELLQRLEARAKH